MYRLPIIRNIIKQSIKQNRAYSIMSRIQGHRYNIDLDDRQVIDPDKIETPKEIIKKDKIQKDKSLPINNSKLPSNATPVPMQLRFAPIYKDFEQPLDPKSIKICLMGAANAGKSSLLNKLIEDKVSTVSNRPQTTRKRQVGILTQDNQQVIFLDTPGVTTSVIDPRDYDNKKMKFNRELTNAPWQSFNEADHLCLIFDLFKLLNLSCHAENYILKKLNNMKTNKPITIMFNKMDLINDIDNAKVEIIDRFKQQYPNLKFTPFFISVKENIDINLIKQHLLDLTVSRKWNYPNNVTSELSDYDKVVEAIREAYFNKLHSYLPYAFQQQNLHWQDNEECLRIDQLVLIKSVKHKKILVGSNGNLINQVVQEATMSLRRQFKKKVKLYIHLKVVDKFINQN